MNKSNRPPHQRKVSGVNNSLSKTNNSMRFSFSPMRSVVVTRASMIKNDLNDSVEKGGNNVARMIDMDNEQQMRRDAFNPKEYTIPGLNEKDITLLKEVFDYYDADRNGQLAPGEIRAALINGGYQASKETIYDIMAEYDSDERGGLIFEEFLKMMVRGPPTQYETKDDILKIFHMFNKDKKDYIDINDLRKSAQELNEDIDEETLQEILHKADSNMDGKITFNDFYNIMTRKIIP